MSRAELGSRAAIATRRLADVEEGRAGATLDVWVRIVGTLGVSPDDLLAGVRWGSLPGRVGAGEGSYVIRRRSI